VLSSDAAADDMADSGVCFAAHDGSTAQRHPSFHAMMPAQRL